MTKYFYDLKIKINKNLTSKRKRLIIALFYTLIILTSTSLIKPSVVTVFSYNSEISQQNTAKLLPIYSVDRKDNKIAISFDAAWGAEDTEELLLILEEEGVKTTFFVCGYWVDKNPAEVKMMHEAGHDIASHGNTHAHGSKLTKEQNMEEIQGVHDKVNDLLGIEMNLFRPPYGEYNNNVIEAANALGYKSIQWDVDSHDTKTQVYKRLV
jgi:peptidoglycan-N-acetylglucosamine deacetylase